MMHDYVPIQSLWLVPYTLFLIRVDKTWDVTLNVHLDPIKTT
jgi:hypothetical protein